MFLITTESLHEPLCWNGHLWDFFLAKNTAKGHTGSHKSSYFPYK